MDSTKLRPTVTPRKHASATMVGFDSKTQGAILRGGQRATEQLSLSLERLSSGQRINRASDDPGAVALSAALKTRANSSRVSARAIDQGISFFNVSDSGLSALSNIVTEQLEIATQATNSNLSASQREAYESEINALGEEYNRIVTTLRFNSQYVLDGSIGSLSRRRRCRL